MVVWKALGVFYIAASAIVLISVSVALTSIWKHAKESVPICHILILQLHFVLLRNQNLKLGKYHKNRYTLF